MRKYFVLILLFYISSVFSQPHYIGVRTAINFTNVTTENLFEKDDKKYRSDFYGEVFYEYPVNERIFIASGTSYSRRGFAIDAYYTDADGKVVSSHPVYFNYDYISFPIVLGYRYRTRGNINVFAKTGFLPSYLVSANTKFSNVDQNGQVISREAFDVTDRVNKLDIGGIIEVGTGYEIRKSYMIFGSLSYNRSFNTLTNSNYYSFSKIWHNGIIISVGLNYRLFE